MAVYLLNYIGYKQITKGNTMIIYILRHGTTEWNARHLIQGQTDIPLDDFGQQMACETGLGLAEKNIKFDRIYSSPLKRSFETASIVNREISKAQIIGNSDRNALIAAPAEITTDDRLKELGFGFMDGGNVEEMTADENCPFRYFKSAPDLYEQELKKIKSESPDNRPELLSELCERSKSFLQDVIEPLALEESEAINTDDSAEANSTDSGNPKERTILLSTHGAQSKALLMHINGNSDLSTFWGEGLLPNCGIAIVSLTHKDGKYIYKVLNPSIVFYSNDISKNAPKLL